MGDWLSPFVDLVLAVGTACSPCRPSDTTLDLLSFFPGVAAGVTLFYPVLWLELMVVYDLPETIPEVLNTSGVGGVPNPDPGNLGWPEGYPEHVNSGPAIDVPEGISQAEPGRTAGESRVASNTIDRWAIAIVGDDHVA